VDTDHRVLTMAVGQYHRHQFIINLFAIFSYQIADIYHAMAGHQKNTKFN